jgi:hypothetical protein
VVSTQSTTRFIEYVFFFFFFFNKNQYKIVFNIKGQIGLGNDV